MSLTSSSQSYEHLLPPSWKRQITEWLAEDTPSFDYGGYVVGEAQREAFLFGKGSQPAVLAGSPFFTEIFTQLGCESASLLENVPKDPLLSKPP
jgi:nicotinate-nucleotide pyrophosphorylase (carboxylating)